jgi:Uma2 family endonuclease
MGRTRARPTQPAWTLEDVLKRFRHIPARRIRLNPAPGTATEEDVLRLMDKEDRLYELVDGVLVEKVMGYKESGIAMDLVMFLGLFVREHDLGLVTGPDGTVRLLGGLVRMPDVAFVSWNQLPDRFLPTEPVPDLAPDLAVEVLSEGNTAAEMQQKLKEYFLAGVRLVWFIDPDTRTATVYTSPETARKLTENDALDGGDVVPGFRLPLKQLFARLKPDGATRGKGRKKGRRG